VNNAVMTLPKKLREFIVQPNLNTPFLVVDLERVLKNYCVLTSNLPAAKCFYSVKSNPSPQVLKTLLAKGSHFEAASLGEIELCLSVGVQAKNIHFGNTVKSISSLKQSVGYGIQSFAFDCKEELLKLHELAPGAAVICRIATTGEGATWGLCNKFGCSVSQASDLLAQAHSLGMGKLGVSFHVGSQQKSPLAWQSALLNTKTIIDELSSKNVQVDTINLGGGFPASGYLNDKNMPISYDVAHYCQEISSYISQIFGPKHKYNFMCEPGRFLLSEAGCIKTEVILATHKIINQQQQKWLYLDVGKFNGLYEGTDIKHPVYYAHDLLDELIDTTLAGPSCDSDDMLSFENDLHKLPKTLKAGDHITFMSTGAYSNSYMSVGFNGIPPLTEYYI
jgi:ornithine decarboxylase